ncbi:unnamed protein product [Rhizophagus irregularis]|nr:unnamed protein product [Rhizophagus irregularis]
MKDCLDQLIRSRVRSITCGLYNIGDGCFWIIGRVGLQALKCVNDLFDTVTNSDRITSEKTNRSLEFGRVELWISLDVLVFKSW